MILDTSALIEVLRQQPRAVDCLDVLEHSSSSTISAANYFEACIVADNLDMAPFSGDLDLLIRDYRIEIVPVTTEHARIARLAHRRYGRGNHNDSKAKLNFGDCFAYALARERNEPLLFVGDDFTHTDIRPALAPE
jgi:ribonuclease VapC